MSFDQLNLHYYIIKDKTILLSTGDIDSRNQETGSRFTINIVFPNMEIPIIKIRRP